MPSVAYDPRVDSLASQMDEIRRMNQAILDRMNQPAPPPPPQVPRYTEDDFRDKPVEVLSSLVEQNVSKAVDKLRSDIQGQLTPVNEFIGQTRRQSLSDQIIAQLKGNAQFSRLNEPAVETSFRNALANYSGDVTFPAMTNLYIWAIGAASVGGFNPNPQNTPAPNTPATPAHIRPDSRPNGNQGNFVLPPLEQNEARLARENGWSHARAAYAYKKISWDQYHQIEPTGKPIEGI